MVEIGNGVHGTVLAIDIGFFLYWVNKPAQAYPVLYPNLTHFLFQAGNTVAAGADFNHEIWDDGGEALALFGC